MYCDNYHSTEEKIKSALLQNLSDLVNITLSTHGTPDITLISAADLIITTKPLKLFGKKVITISPFYLPVDQLHVLTEVQQLLDYKDKIRRNALFSRFFHEQLFFINSDNIQSGEDAIRFLGQKLVDLQLVDNTFIDSALTREQMSSTCFFNLFAIPHSMELNAQKTTCCILLCPEGIQWNKDSKAYIVLMIAVQKNDRADFMELYEALINVFQNPEKIAQLTTCRNFEEFMKLLL